ncbi:siderophore-interacting protein [Pelagibacterium sp. 26DY04]|uniref:siderophore-interacting protein n=1 Tax=Pelagibacterium sp. 26DY04 TaxID=2967130 RepID=UPI002814FF97|nr:siderophore-interacting protein [Pelagibacterium sp. 26DY04]WMT86312.1 siderophore-interacting protein [Pelagibacterium sp. 26DY04]
MDYEKPATLKLPIVLRQVEVSRTEEVSPTLKRIWFTSDELKAFSKDGRNLPPFRSEGPEDHVKFFFPSPVDGVLSLPVQADGTIDWPKNPRPVARDYTPRGYRDGDTEVAFDFVLHGHGVASTWAATAKPGDRLHMAGPKASMTIPDADHFVLIADQTALPALCNWLEMLPQGKRVDALVWIDEEKSRIEIETTANVHWIVDANPEGMALIEAARALPRPGGNSFVWGAMEAGVLRKVRSLYLDEMGLERGQIDMAAYWRRGVDDDQLLADAMRIKETGSLEKPFLIRTAVQFRLPDLVSEGVDSLEALAQRAGVNADALARLMPGFVELGIFKRSSERITLGLAGDLLTSPFRRALFSQTTAKGRLHLAARGLPHFLQTGESAYKATFGTELEDDAANDREIGDQLGHELGHMVEALTSQTLGPLAAACGSKVTVIGTGAEAIVMSLFKNRPEMIGTAMVPGWALDEAREHIEEAGLKARAELAELGTALPHAETLVISAIGRRWSDAIIESIVAAQEASDIWLIELVARPESLELAEDAALIDAGFGLRPTELGPLTANLAEYGLAPEQTHTTRTGLRLTRFVATV